MFELSTQTGKVNIGIIGLGAMGRGLLYQSRITPGLECVAVADLNLERCIETMRQFGLDYRVVESVTELNRAVAEGQIAVCQDGELLAVAEPINLLVEASSSIAAAGRFGVAALGHGKHLVLMNSEIDLIFGPYLARLAQRNNVVYTSCDGDQYGVIKHLIDELKMWGFELVMAGNIKGFLDRYANPTSIIPEADKRRLDYKMCTSYTDGTKLGIEMALVANAFGLDTATTGMLGPKAGHVSEALRLFDFDRLWLKRGRQPFVDYILGAEPGGGVFAVGYSDHPYQREMLAYYKMGNGPYYLFYRPYHLCHIEAMAGIAAAALKREVLMQPQFGLRTNVYAYAKRDLKKGERLDGIGGYTCYGLIENCDDQAETPGLPICLAEETILHTDIPRDKKILWSDVIMDRERTDLAMYSEAVNTPAWRTA